MKNHCWIDPAGSSHWFYVHYRLWTRLRIYPRMAWSGQGVVVLQSFAFFLIFAAFNAAQSLVGSIPTPDGLAAFQFMAL